MCPEVVDEANPGKKASPTGRTEAVRCSAVGSGGSGLACSMLSLEARGICALLRCGLLRR